MTRLLSCRWVKGQHRTSADSTRRRWLVFSGTIWTCATTIITAALLILLTSESSTLAEPLELAIKANYLERFAPFIEWPSTSFATADASLTICVLANDPLAPLLEQAAAGQKDGSRLIIVRRLGQTDSAAQCQIFYFEPDDPVGKQIAENLQNHPVLTVTSAAAEQQTPAIITFVIDQNRVRFDIDNTAASHAGLNIGSNLLALARTVRRTP